MSTSLQTPASVFPPMPNKAQYTIGELRRTDLQVSEGPYDPGRFPKYWADPDAASKAQNGMVIYTIDYFLDNGKTQVKTLLLNVDTASRANIPPVAQIYPPYVVPETKATTGGSGIDPIRLCTFMEAVMVAGWFNIPNAASEIHDQNFPGFPTQYPDDEPRRQWGFLMDGMFQLAGVLMYTKNKNGVGAPGHWERGTPGSELAGPKWIEEPNGVKDTRDPVPLPLRELTPVEHLVQIGLASTVIERTDLAATTGGTVVTPVTGPVLTDEQFQMLKDCYAMLQVIFQGMTGKPFTR